MVKVILRTPYPTIEETARLLGIGAEEREAIVASIAPKIASSRGLFVEIQGGKTTGGLNARLRVKPTRPRGARTRRGASSGSGRAKSEQQAKLKTLRLRAKV